jgi:Tol biopolymer transport system component
VRIRFLTIASAACIGVVLIVGLLLSVTYPITNASAHATSAKLAAVRYVSPAGSDLENDWANNSRQIAFRSNRSGDWDYYIMSDDGSIQMLWDNPAGDAMPAWSPDATRIAFVSNRTGSSNLYVANSDGSSVTQLTFYSAPIAAVSPDWSPDGNQIVFWTNLDNGIYVINVDGTGLTRLTQITPGFKLGPRWSPDGSKIAFSWGYDLDTGNISNHAIYVMNNDGSNLLRLTSNDFNDNNPFWSPDGTKLAFNSDRDGHAQIYVMNVDGSEQTRLTHNNYDDAQPIWSSDGTRILYTSVVQRAENGAILNSEIFVINSDGSGQTNLTNYAARDGAPVWLPVLAAMEVNYSTGAPGSFFTVNVSNFPVNDTAATLVNGIELGTAPTGSTGNFTFILSTADADEGYYEVLVTVNSTSLTSHIILSNDQPLRPQVGDGPVFDMPAGLAWQKLFLPSIQRN